MKTSSVMKPSMTDLELLCEYCVACSSLWGTKRRDSNLSVTAELILLFLFQTMLVWFGLVGPAQPAPSSALPQVRTAICQLISS
jgi:hypothetical protein